MVSEAKRIANAKYRQEKREQLAVDIPKGKKNVYKAIAAEHGLSLSMLVQRSVETFAGVNDITDLPVKPAPITSLPAEKLSSQEKTLLLEFNKLPTDVRKALLKTIEAINANQSAATENHDTD